MKQLFSITATFFALAANIYAAPFSPATLKLTAPSVVQYNFDGGNLSLPVTVSGTPANVVFLVFTKDQAASIRKVKNGYLGWHYVNNIDTCLYISPPSQFEPGANTASWDGKDENGNPVPPGMYTYYLWGYDNVTPRVQVTKQMKFDPWIHRTIITHDATENPLAQPILYIGGGNRNSSANPVTQIHYKWVIGGDPEDASLRESTTTQGWCGVGGIAFQPDDYRYFFYDTLKEAGTKITEKYEWVPNGEATLQTAWGNNGRFTYTGTWSVGWNYGPGCVSDGKDYLFAMIGDMGDDGNSGKPTESKLIYIDIHTGKEIKRFDLSPWFINMEDEKNGGQRSGGPSELYLKHGLAAIGGHSTCINMLFNPYYADESDAVEWVNGNGDYTGDHNFEPDSPNKWVCNDYNVGPYKYNVSMDNNLFCVFPCYGVGPVSFGLYAPDGTGMGYYAVSKDNDKGKLGVEIIDYGSVYDGMYMTNNDYPGTSWTSIDKTFWYVAHDSFKGSIVSSGSYLWLSSPNGGEVWGTGIVHTIRWQSSGVDKARIEYSRDNGSSWNMIADNVDAASGSYSWTPEGVQSEKCLIRVISASDNSIQTVSRAPFTITSPFVKLTAPNGGEILETGVANTISWTYFGIESVKIEFSPDNGSSWTGIVSNVQASQKSYSWKVPETVSGQCLVRVSDASNASVFDLSDAAFQITAGFIRLTAPNGGEEWEAGQTREITWSASSGILKARLEFSSDGGAQWNVIADNIAASPGTNSWKVPNLPSPRCLIRVTDAGSTGLSDSSDGPFAITPSQWITYTRADGLASNDINAIAVEKNGTLCFGSRDNGVSSFDGVNWTTYNKSNSGIVSNDFLWIEPDRDEKLWFGSTWDGASCYDGKTWTNYSQVKNIRCIVVDFNNVKWFGEWVNGLTAFDGTKWTRYTTSNGLLVNHCETAMLDTDNSIWVGYRIGSGISKFDGKTWQHFSTSDGLINDAVRAMAIDKDGVRWFGTSEGISSYNGNKWTNYPKTLSMPYNTIEAVAVDENNVKWFGTYGGGALSFDGIEWKQYKTQKDGICANDIIRVLVDKNNAVWFASRTNGVSCYVNYSGPYVRVASPNGGELWEAGSAHEITWIHKDVERIRIEYSPDNGSTWSVIASNVDAAGQTYTWTLPQAQSFQCKIRLTDVSDDTHTGASNGVFTISPPFVKVTSPNGGERWASGSAHPITWSSIGVERVKLEYSVDDGDSWQVINTVDASSGSYAWTVPAVESERCRVRAADISAADRTDAGDAVFTIMKPYITVTAPNGGENWPSGSAHQISWQADGVNTVRIEYSVDGGLSWNLIAGNVNAANGFYTWRPLSVESLLCIVRVSDQAKEGIFDASDNVFSVKVYLFVEEIPQEFAVFPNRPNPFNPSTTIFFTLPKAERVTVDIFSVSGQKAGCAFAGSLEPGKHSVVWKADGLSAGMYFACVRAGAEVKTIKMLMVK